jgi:hypothetical protein
LKLELSADDLFIIKQSIEEITVKGKDAMRIGKLLVKVENAFVKEAEKSK